MKLTNEIINKEVQEMASVQRKSNKLKMKYLMLDISDALYESRLRILDGKILAIQMNKSNI